MFFVRSFPQATESFWQLVSSSNQGLHSSLSGQTLQENGIVEPVIVYVVWDHQEEVCRKTVNLSQCLLCLFLKWHFHLFLLQLYIVMPKVNYLLSNIYSFDCTHCHHILKIMHWTKFVFNPSGRLSLFILSL